MTRNERHGLRLGLGRSCGIDIRFYLDGTATVSRTQLMATQRDTAQWSQAGSELHPTYDTWGGGIDGGRWEGGIAAGQTVETIHATETWQDDSGALRARLHG